VLYCPSLLLAHSVPSFLSFRPIPVFSLLVLTFKSLIFFLEQPLSPGTPEFLSHTPRTLPVVSGFFHSLHSFLLVCVFVPFTQVHFLSSIFLLLLIFPLLHWHTHFSGSISLSAYSAYTLPSLCNLGFLCPLLAPLSNIFLTISLPLLVPFTPRSLPRTSTFSLSYSQTFSS
jgi:hypothetical protein